MQTVNADEVSNSSNPYTSAGQKAIEGLNSYKKIGATCTNFIEKFSTPDSRNQLKALTIFSLFMGSALAVKNILTVPVKIENYLAQTNATKTINGHFYPQNFIDVNGELPIG